MFEHLLITTLIMMHHNLTDSVQQVMDQSHRPFASQFNHSSHNILSSFSVDSLGTTHIVWDITPCVIFYKLGKVETNSSKQSHSGARV